MTDFSWDGRGKVRSSVALRYDGAQAPVVVATGAGEVADKSTCRSVYRRVMRNSPDEVLHAFDVPDHISHMPQRSVTTTPTQSLLLLNSGWIRARAFALAKRLAKRHPGEVGGFGRYLCVRPKRHGYCGLVSQN